MDEALRRRFERQREAAIGSSGAEDSGQSNQAMEVLRRSFERHAGDRREQQEQVQQTRQQRAMKFWQEASNETEES